MGINTKPTSVIRNLFVVAFINACFLSGCATNGQAWQESKPLNLPHTVTSISGVDLVIDVIDDTLIYRIECATSGKFRVVGLVAQVNGTDVAGDVQLRDVDCSNEAHMIADGNLPTLNMRRIGDTITFTFTVEGDPLQQDLVKQDIILMVGTNGSLHEGLGSVWLDERPWWQRW